MTNFGSPQGRITEEVLPHDLGLLCSVAVEPLDRFLVRN